MRNAILSLILGLSTALVACGDSSADPDDPGGGDGDTDPGDEVVDRVAGAYEVTSHYDLQDSPNLPTLLTMFTDALAPLSNLKDDPSGTVLAILDAAGIDDLQNLINSLPADEQVLFLETFDQVVLDQLEAHPEIESMLDNLDDIGSQLSYFDVVTTLGVTPAKDDGTAKGNHTLAAVSFPFQGENMMVETPDLLNNLTAVYDVELSVTVDDSGEGELTIGDHAFHVPLGENAVGALNAVLEATVGVATVRDGLGQFVDCDAITASVLDSCGVACVALQSEIEEGCNTGLEVVAQTIEDSISSLEYAELHFSGGIAVLQDGDEKADSVDGLTDYMTGEWDSDFNVDGTQVLLPATFTARRVRPIAD